MNAARLETLRYDLRHADAGPGPDNHVGGLIDLIEYARPRSVLEIGSHCGVSTEAFLLHCERVVAVDPWPYKRYWLAFLGRCGEYDNLGVVKGISPDDLKQFADGAFDMVYIDGEHYEGNVIDDITASRRLVTRWIAGHDYGHLGVGRAVRKLLGEPERVFSDTSWIVPVRCGA